MGKSGHIPKTSVSLAHFVKIAPKKLVTDEINH